MDSATCATCQTELPARAIFCGNCCTPVRCVNCKDLLDPNAKFCIVCGKRVGDGAASVAHDDDRPVLPVNKIRYEETTTSRSFEASFTNESAAALGSWLGTMPGSLMRDRLVASGVINPEVGERSDDPQMPALEQAIKSVQVGEVVEMSATNKEARVASELQRVFRREGDEFRLDDPRLKPGSKADATRRFVHLYLLACSVLDGRDSVPREELVEVAKHASLYDGNFNKAFNPPDNISIEDRNVRLMRPGREAAEQFLSEVLDDKVVGSWPPKSGSGSSVAKSKSGAQGDGAAHVSERSQRRQLGPSKALERMIASWNEMGPPIDGHAALQGKSMADKGLIGLWAIRLSTGDDAKMVGRETLANFILHAFEIQVSGGGLQKALEKVDDSRIIRGGGTKFRITSSGIKYVQQLVGLQTDQAVISANGSSNTVQK